MSNEYLKSKIRKYELYRNIIVGILIIFAYLAGRYVIFSNYLLNLALGIMLGIAGGVSLFVVEYLVKKQINYNKGLKLEEQIEKKLKEKKIEYNQHVETEYGDLDFLIKKDDFYYGVEAKNWAGSVIFENGLLKVAGWNNNDILSTLLKHCKLVRNKKLGGNSGKFIKPVLVFGYKADVKIYQNKIIFNGVEVLVVSINDFIGTIINHDK